MNSPRQAASNTHRKTATVDPNELLAVFGRSWPEVDPTQNSMQNDVAAFLAISGTYGPQEPDDDTTEITAEEIVAHRHAGSKHTYAHRTVARRGIRIEPLPLTTNRPYADSVERKFVGRALPYLADERIAYMIYMMGELGSIGMRDVVGLVIPHHEVKRERDVARNLLIRTKACLADNGYVEPFDVHGDPFDKVLTPTMSGLSYAILAGALLYFSNKVPEHSLMKLLPNAQYDRDANYAVSIEPRLRHMGHLVLHEGTYIPKPDNGPMDETQRKMLRQLIAMGWLVPTSTNALHKINPSTMPTYRQLPIMLPRLSDDEFTRTLIGILDERAESGDRTDINPLEILLDNQKLRIEKKPGQSQMDADKIALARILAKFEELRQADRLEETRSNNIQVHNVTFTTPEKKALLTELVAIIDAATSHDPLLGEYARFAASEILYSKPTPNEHLDALMKKAVAHTAKG